MLIFDIGAYKGEYTDKYLAEGARVVAVEPQEVHANGLRAKYAGKPVTVVQAAVGAANGTAMLYQTRASWFASLKPERWKVGRFSGYEWREAYPVEVITLDALIERFGMPDFIKIDTEGGELEVIAGLTRPAPLLSYEFTRELLDDTQLCGLHLLEIGRYEFSISFVYDDKPNRYMTLERTMDILRHNENPLLWGNIYARLTNG